MNLKTHDDRAIKVIKLIYVHCSKQFVYVIGIHAVQFGNNWMTKIPRTAESNLAVQGMFLIQLFPNWTSM